MTYAMHSDLMLPSMLCEMFCSGSFFYCMRGGMSIFVSVLLYVKRSEILLGLIKLITSLKPMNITKSRNLL